jgi:hypothetical protein
MWELLSENPWLIPVILGMLIPITGIVFGTVTHYLQKTRQAELDAGLKHEMLQRGMSADEIVQVIRAKGRGSRCDVREEREAPPTSQYERR